MKTFWTTFYSYKGGVGRSLALANIAALLVQRGRRVVLIDFDLEAPGLDSFKDFECVTNKPGVVEYVTQFTKNHIAPDIREFVHPCELDGHLRGKLWIMPAGKKDALYNACRANIDWADLYEHHYGEQFVENWKIAIANQFQPDYVLVDSRTGLTDVGGICTLHLPDLVVMLFGLNEQNVRGVAEVAKAIRKSELTRLPQIHYVASPIPNLPPARKGPIEQRLKAATEQIGAKIDSYIRYQPIAALSERLFVLDPDFGRAQTPHPFGDSLDIQRGASTWNRSTLVQDYSDLLAQLIKYNRSGLDFLWNQAQDAISKMDNVLMERLLPVFETEFPNRPDGYMARALLSRALNLSDQAVQLATNALKLDPAYESPFRWLIAHYRRQGDYQSAMLICNLVFEQIEKIPFERQRDLFSQRGQIAMAIGEYAIAEKSNRMSQTHLTKQKKQWNDDPEIFMIELFNDAEASRRAHNDPESPLWQQVIELFKITGEASSMPLDSQANRWQAIHIAFALTGRIHLAREALSKARQAADRLGPTEEIFTVKKYAEVLKDEFLAINDEMLSALDRGELWDGMKLPSPQGLL